MLTNKVVLVQLPAVWLWSTKQLLWRQNTLADLLMSAAIALVVLLLSTAAVGLVVRRLARVARLSPTDFDDFLVDQLRRVGPWVALPLALELATRPLDLPLRAERVIDWVFAVALGFRALRFIQACIHYGLRRVTSDTTDAQPGRLAMARSLGWLVDGALWTAALLLVIANLGIDVSSLLTGLGIGGVALALALQTLLKDPFATLSLLLDRPFQIGDLVTIGTLTGHVVTIGLRSSRLRSLSGETVIVPNSDLMTGRVQNFREMSERRVLHRLGLRYGLCAAECAEVPGLLEEAVRAEPGVRFDRAHLANLADYSLQYELVFFIESAEYATYMERNQAILLRILTRLESKGFALAYPTSTVRLEQVG